MVFAIDFDGTLVSSAYPNIGEPNWPLVAKVKSLQTAGHEIILWTCRTGALLSEALTFCTTVLQLHFDHINESSPTHLALYQNLDPRKIGADYYVDDKCLSLHEFINMKVENEDSI